MFVLVNVEYRVCDGYGGNRRCNAEIKLNIPCDKDWKIVKRYANGEMFYGECLYGTWGISVKVDEVNYREKLIARIYANTWEEVEEKIQEEVEKVNAFLKDANDKFIELASNIPDDKTIWLLP